MKTASKENTICTVCDIGRFRTDSTQFSVDRGSKIMLIGNVPALVCNACGSKQFDEEISRELIQQTEAIFAKSSGRMFGYQFTDFIRTGERQSFKLFQRVRIKDDVNTWDMYDEGVEPGMEGTVIDKGLNRFDYFVEFVIGRRAGKENILQVEIDEEDLEPVGQPIQQQAKRTR